VTERPEAKGASPPADVGTPGHSLGNVSTEGQPNKHRSRPVFFRPSANYKDLPEEERMAWASQVVDAVVEAAGGEEAAFRKKPQTGDGTRTQESETRVN